jgi:hypothetical protein
MLFLVPIQILLSQVACIFLPYFQAAFHVELHLFEFMFLQVRGVSWYHRGNTQCFPAALVCFSPMEAKRLDSNPSSKICCTLSNYSLPGEGGLQHLNGKCSPLLSGPSSESLPSQKLLERTSIVSFVTCLLRLWRSRGADCESPTNVTS